jgi:chromosome condensin MukBEF ATPase and DNA-binding subunit MukB
MHGAIMGESDLNRELGSLITQIEVLNREMKEVKTDVRQMRDDFSAVKGGWRVMLGIAALIGSGLTWGLTQIFGKH